MARGAAQFAFGRPTTLVDSNFARILERVFELQLPTQPHQSEPTYRIVEALVPAEAELARAFNFALLDLGELVCTPETPRCKECPLITGCTYGQSP